MSEDSARQEAQSESENGTEAASSAGRRRFRTGVKLGKVTRVLVYLVLLAVGPVGVFLLLPTSVRYQIVERYELAADAPDVDVYLAVMLPKSGPYQTVENVTVDWPGKQTHRPYESVDVVLLDGVTGGEGNVSATFAYDVTLRQGRASWDAPIREEHLGPEPEIESDAPALEAKAEELDADGSRESAYRMYTFTTRHLSWPKGTWISEGQSALAAYESGMGVCAEHANLMTALCRAAGIPAKSITGLFMPQLQPPYTTKTRTGLHPAGSHAWVEVYSDGNWRMVDPSWATNTPLDRLWFGRSMGQHLSYGESAQHDQIFDEMTTWGESQGEIAGAMWAPLRYVAAAEQDGATVQPVVSLKKTHDIRWFAAVGLYIAITVAYILLEKYLQKSKQTTDDETHNTESIAKEQQH